MHVEHIIRDWFIANPEFIEKGLKVLDKEHYLPDEKGTSGLIDILCTDFARNFVIIEIKRSNPASRQTFTEIFKYAELIKENYKVRDSEIRMIIISTHWDEMIRAFSFTCFKSPFPIKGLRLHLNNETLTPDRLEDVEPISSVEYSRQFMSYQIIYLFALEEKHIIANKILNQKLKKANCIDYVTVELKAPPRKELYHPYALYVAFQKQPTNKLLNFITLLDGNNHLDMEEHEFDDDNEYISYLEQVFIASLNMGNHVDDTEVGYAEKFESIIGVQDWHITSINRYGLFKNDPRYSDDLLLKELKGHDGTSSNKFVAFSDSDQKERLKEIYRACQHCLSHTPQWASLIEQLLLDLQTSTKKFKLLVDIYNPDSILTSFYFSLIKGNPDYMPLFLIFVDYGEKNQMEVYTGEILSFGRRPTLKLFTSTDHNEISNELWELTLMPDNEITAFKMGLRYTVSKADVVEGKKRSTVFLMHHNGNIVSDDTVYSSIKDYVLKNQASIALMVKNYSSNYATL